MERMYQIVALLNKYAKEYYEDDRPTVSDADYDKLYDELLALEQSTGIVMADSPTKRVGGRVSGRFMQFTHKERLYSLDKTKTVEGVKDWTVRVNKGRTFFAELTLEYKLDGLTVNITYDKGRLVRACTRGNGEVGEVVTEQIKAIKSIPQNIDFQGLIDIQGEGIMRLSALKTYNETAKVPLKNARNGVAGAIRNLDVEETAKRKLSFIAYNVGYHEGIEFHKQREVNDFLKRQGFETSDFFEIVEENTDIAKLLIDAELRRPNLDYLIDGMVFKVDSFALREELGFTEKFPRWAIAYKFKAEEVVTKVEDVIWQVSRTGKLNPLAILTPVDIGGATVSRTTLSNYSEIKRKDIKIGSNVFVRRSGDVIPEILGVASHTDESREIEKPKVCPYCGSEVKEQGYFLYCGNPDNCAPRVISQIEHFCSKEALDIKGISVKTAEQMYNELSVRDVADLYTLKRSDLLGLEGYKDKKADNVLAALEKSKNTTLTKFLTALGIDGIGKKAAKVLEANFHNLDAVKRATVEQLAAINDFGLITANNVVNYFKNDANIKLLERLLSYGFTFKKEEVAEGVFSGKTVVLTGSLDNFKRSAAAQEITKRGGAVADSVSSFVNLVVAGSDAGSKLQKAQKLGIEIIDEAAFTVLLNK